MGMLLTPQMMLRSVGTMSTLTKKTTKMLHKYREYAKLLKGWVIMPVEDNEVEKVWQQQKKALSDSIIPGLHTWLQSKPADKTDPLCPMASSPT